MFEVGDRVRRKKIYCVGDWTGGDRVFTIESKDKPYFIHLLGLESLPGGWYNIKFEKAETKSEKLCSLLTSTPTKD